ncbi:MAG: serine hydrolase [Fimbriimonadaceae bacterium]|nr:serine hydrolase [Fimbriimonadaceae bacterium]
MFAALLLIAAQATSTITPAQSAAIQEVLKPWNTQDAPGGVVGIYKDGQVVFSAGLGLADMEQGTKLTPESVMDIGSISKQFVAASIIRLQEEGKLSLDDSVRKHLPELPEFMEEIKLHNLIHHNSGLRDYLNLTVLETAGLSDVPTADEMLKMMSQQKELNFPVGRGVMYCNTGYAMLAEVIKRTEKTDLTTATRRLVWEPLGMAHTQFDQSTGLIVPGRANSYVKTPEGYVASRIRAEIVGDGGVLTTVGDMAKWAAFLGNPKPEYKAFHDLMIKPSSVPMSPRMRYASGLFLDDLDGVKRVQHGGDWSGFHAQFSVYPDSGWAVFTSGNDGTQLAKSMNDAIARILLGLKPPASATQTQSGEFGPINDEEEKAMTGTYVLAQVNLPVEFKVEDGVLFALPKGQPPTPLKRIGTWQYRFDALDATFTFAEPKDGECPSVTLVQAGMTLPGNRAEPFVADSAILNRWAGTYHSDELGYDILIARDGEKLIITINGNEWGEGTLGSATSLSVGSFVTISVEGEDDPIKSVRVDAGGRASRLLFVRTEE